MSRHIVRAHRILALIKTNILSWGYMVTDDATGASCCPYSVSATHTPTNLCGVSPHSFPAHTHRCDDPPVFTSPSATAGCLARALSTSTGPMQYPWDQNSCSGSEQTPGLEWPRPSNLMFGTVTTAPGTEGQCHENQRTVQRLCSGTKMWRPGRAARVSLFSASGEGRGSGGGKPPLLHSWGTQTLSYFRESMPPSHTTSAFHSEI